MKSLFRLSAGLILSVSVITSAAANDHKILGVIAMPRNETNDLTLKLPVCRVVKRIQLSAERGDIQLFGATVYFKASHGASRTLNVPAGIKEGNTTGWITLNNDNDNKRCVKKSPSQATRSIPQIWPH